MKKAFIWVIVLILAVLGILWIRGMSNVTGGNNQSISDGTITISFSPTDFGLAINQTQILKRSYIPSCDENFNYCLYYIGSTYQGTNFESAGLRISKRPDLKTENDCLSTGPNGYSALTPKQNSQRDYGVSVFSPLGDGAAGHYASGALYRLFFLNSSGQMSCYEFETRIGQTQFANYPAGSIKQFTSADEKNLESELNNVLKTITLPSGQKNLFSGL